MTDKEKIKAYDEALERARKMLNMILDNELLGFPDQIREIFPQLCESEEKQSMTRKEAIGKVFGMIGTAEQHEALEFLVPEVRELRESYDKQQEDEKIRKSLIKNFKNYYEMYDKSCGEPKWGSDSLAVKDILAYLKKQKTDHDNLTSMIKSLRPSWKPTKDQIKVLQWCKPLFYEPNCKKILESLIDDLQKLL